MHSYWRTEYITLNEADHKKICLFVSHQQPWSYGDGGYSLKVSSHKLEKPGIEPVTPGVQGKWFIHYTTATFYQKSHQ